MHAALLIAALTALSPLAAHAGDENAPLPYGALPSRAQVEWHRLEFYGFIHFGTNTFTDREWGQGNEDPAIVAPTALDCRQWARVAKAAGMKGLILTAKHHDGLCLWPTSTTPHNISKSPLQNGQADIVSALSEACAFEGLKFGVYLSPWDCNNADYGKPEYVATYRAQLTELITRYGPLFEVWHDGANGGRGYYGGANETRTIDKLSYYGWPETWALVAKHQPDAIVFSDAGPHCRWVGNERGITPETSWQTIDNAGRMPGLSYDDLGSGKPAGTHWVGVEADVSIRPGWFYHSAEDSKVKTPAQLLDIWFDSVGRGSNLILNIPPDRRGLINEIDAKNLESLGTILRETFATNLAAGAKATASSSRHVIHYNPSRLIDANPDTAWAPTDNARDPSVTITLPEPRTFNVFRIEEAISLGQRVKSFTVSAEIDGQWKQIAAATTIGPRRVLRLESPVTCRALRVDFTECLAPPVISEISLHTLAHIPE